MQFFISASHKAELSYFDFMHGFSCRFMQNSVITFFASFRWTDATWYIFQDVLVVFALLIITLVCGFSFNQQYLIAIGFFMKNLCSDLPLSLALYLTLEVPYTLPLEIPHILCVIIVIHVCAFSLRCQTQDAINRAVQMRMQQR